MNGSNSHWNIVHYTKIEPFELMFFFSPVWSMRCVYFLFAFKWMCVIRWNECVAEQHSNEKMYKCPSAASEHPAYISYGIQMNLRAQQRKSKGMRMYTRDHYFIITCFDDDCIGTPTIYNDKQHDHKIFISPRFVFDSSVLVYAIVWAN